MPLDTQANIVPHINTGELRDANRVRALLSSPDIHVAYLLGDNHDWIDYALAQPNIQLVIVRRWNPFGESDGHERDVDGSMHQRRSPEQVYAHFVNTNHVKYKGNPKIRWIWGWNEPQHNPSDPERDLLQLNTWMAKIAELFAGNGYGVALGGYAVAKTNSLPIRDITTWQRAWKLVLDVAAKYPDFVVVDFHEYEFAFLPINSLVNINTPFPFSFLDKRIVDPANWGSIPYTGAGINHNWKLGNIANILEYNRELGHPPLKWGRGEWGTDTMTESWWWNNSIDGKKPLEQTWREMFGVTAKGVHTLFKYHAYLHDKPNTYTMAEHNLFIIQQAKWFKANSGPGCLYNAHFAWNTNSYWRTEDISHPDYEPYIYWMRFQQHTVDTPQPAPIPIPIPTPQPQPSPAPTFETRRIQGNGTRVTLRATPDITSAALGVLSAAPTVTVADVSSEVTDPQGLQWRQVRWNGIEGYLAFKYVVDAPEPTDEQVMVKLKAIQVLIDDILALLAA